MTDADAQLLQLFREEANDIMQALNDALLQIEMSPDAPAPALLREMNRMAHSLKGAARAVGYNRVERISHRLEDLLGQAYAGTLTLSPNVADSIYDALDVIQAELDGSGVTDEVLAALDAALGAHLSAENSDPASDPASDPVPPWPDVELPPGATDAERLRVAVGKLDRLMASSSELLVLRMQADERRRQSQALRQQIARWQRDWRTVRTSYLRLMRRLTKESDTSAELLALLHFLERNERQLGAAGRELAQFARDSAQDALQLTALADQLQADVTGLRMMPFDHISGSFARMVRDIAREQGKQAVLTISGGGVELDKAVLEALKDPLIHLLRNAVDHGLEPPEARQRLGKPPTGQISLKVEAHGSEVAIALSDDGRGLDVVLLRQRAQALGLIDAQQAASLDDDAIRLLIFAPGFSTAEQVTAISGRGLGMDIVRTAIARLRGQLAVDSSPGHGTTLRLRLPLSLARIHAVIVRVGSEDFALPSALIARMTHLSPEALDMDGGRATLHLEGQRLPLFNLGALLGVSSAPPEPVPVVVLQLAERSAAFQVDALISEADLVLKPLGRELAGVPFIAGGALLGSGQVILLLDGADLLQQAATYSLPTLPTPTLPTSGPQEAPLRVLVVDDSITTRTLEKNILEAVGCVVQVATDGVEAWSLLAHNLPDVVISDVEMPHMDGLELTRRIRQHAHTQHLPVILLTSLSQPHQRKAGLKAGADAYLVKSRFDQDELLYTLRRVLMRGEDAP